MALQFQKGVRYALLVEAGSLSDGQVVALLTEHGFTNPTIVKPGSTRNGIDASAILAARASPPTLGTVVVDALWARDSAVISDTALEIGGTRFRIVAMQPMATDVRNLEWLPPLLIVGGAIAVGSYVLARLDRMRGAAAA